MACHSGPQKLARARRAAQIVGLAAAAMAATAAAASAQLVQEGLCDTQLLSQSVNGVQVPDCRTPILDLIRNERQGIDVAFWFMDDARYANELVRWHQAHPTLPIRVLVDERANGSKPINAQILAILRDGGVPMREKVPDPSYTIQILHFKMMLFHGQNVVEFSKANYAPSSFVPISPSNFSDEAIFFTNDDRFTNTFRRRFDDLWTNMAVYQDYANITGPPSRQYPLFPLDPAMNFSPLENFANRAAARFDAEPPTGGLDAIVFRVTDHVLPDAVLRAVARGTPVRLITDYGEYRNPGRLWDAAHIDRMSSGGAAIKVGSHGGAVHEAAIVLHGLGEVIFGSSNWTTPSAIKQDEHNFFYTPSFGKPWFFDWFVDQFERKWRDSALFPDFKPLPPDTPAYSAPLNGSSVPGASVVLKWEGGPWAHFYDIYFGSSSPPPLVAANRQIGSPDPGNPEKYSVNNLLPGTTYYWRVVSRTWAQLAKAGPVWSFTTPPAPDSGGTTPYGGTAAAIPGTIQAENFDEGGQSRAYLDATAGNSGSQYRATDVDIQTTSDSGGGYNVGWTRAGEWLKYTVAVASSGTYQLQARVANTAAGGAFRLEVDGTSAAGPIAVPNTGGYQSWQTITASGVSLTAGQHVLRIVFTAAAPTGGVGNFNWFRLDSASTPPASGNVPFHGAPAPIPGIVQSEDFDEGGQNVAWFDTTSGNSIGAFRASTDVDLEPTTDSGGGFDVAKTRVGEWLEYAVNVAEAGGYDLNVRIANIGSGGTFRMEVDGVDKTGTIAVPDTGGWQTWQTVTQPGIALGAGAHVIRFVFSGAGTSGGAGNYNWFRLDPSSPPGTP